MTGFGESVMCRAGAKQTKHTSNKGVLFYNRNYFSAFVFNLFNGKPRESFTLSAFLCVFAGTSLIDRTGRLDQGFRKVVIDPLPQLDVNEEETPGFDKICDARAKEIINIARNNNQRIHLLWSGGIDSTTALVSLLRNLDVTERRELLTVHYNEHSVDEYPKFYQEFIRPDLDRKRIESTEELGAGKNEIMVTGELGDQLFGSMIMGDLLELHGEGTGIKALHMDYKAVMPDLFRAKLRITDKAFIYRLLDYLEPLIDGAPYPVISAFDFLWWLNFSLKWQHVDQRFAVGFHTGSPRLKHRYQSYIHFFKTQAFQKWSMLNPDKKIKDSWESYKFPAKEYIYELTRDMDYLKNKKKVPSISLREKMDLTYCFMLDDYSIIDAGETLDIKEYRKRHGTEYDWLFV